MGNSIMNRKEIVAAEKELEDKMQEIYDLAHRITVALVKEVMRKNTTIEIFYMAMGSYHFEDKAGNHIDTVEGQMNTSYRYTYNDAKPSFKNFNDFMDKYCTDLGIFGEDTTITRKDL